MGRVRVWQGEEEQEMAMGGFGSFADCCYRPWCWPWCRVGQKVLRKKRALLIISSLTRNRDSKTLAASSGNENSSPSSQVPSGASSASGSATATSTSATASATPTTGAQGSLITLEDGSTMTYDNPYGGKWVWDEANPFKVSSTLRLFNFT